MPPRDPPLLLGADAKLAPLPRELERQRRLHVLRSRPQQAFELVPPETLAMGHGTRRDEQRGWDAGVRERRRRVLQVVAVAVVEGDGCGAGRDVARDDLGERYELPALRQDLELLEEVPRRDAHSQGIGLSIHDAVIEQNERLVLRSPPAPSRATKPRMARLRRRHARAERRLSRDGLEVGVREPVTQQRTGALRYPHRALHRNLSLPACERHRHPGSARCEL